MTGKNINILIVLIIAILTCIYLAIDLYKESDTVAPPLTWQQSSKQKNGIEQIAAAYAQKQSNILVQAGGTVVAILEDDNEGSRHQKFILTLSNGQTILVAHNIDLAPRIIGLQKGDWVDFFGEYEYNDKGGVIHWTHHDPAKMHPNGWLKHQRKIYQ